MVSTVINAGRNKTQNIVVWQAVSMWIEANNQQTLVAVTQHLDIFALTVDSEQKPGNSLMYC